MSDLGVSLEVLRHEGALALRDRVLDRVAEAFRRARLPRLELEDARRVLAPFEPAVLNLSPVAPSPARGGVQIQMLDRLAAERRLRPVAFAFPRGPDLELEVENGPRRGRLQAPARDGLAPAVLELARKLGATVVHVENPAGLPLGLVPALAAGGLTTVVSLHDFSLFCARPHLIEEPAGRFCGFCRDEARCRACLASDGADTSVDQARYRRRGAAVLRAADLVVHASEYLRRTIAELFPDLADLHETVISPASHTVPPGPRRLSLPPLVAFVGGASRHKGGHLFRKIAGLVRREVPGCRFASFGNGERAVLEDLRQDSGILVRGYYRRGRLPGLLCRHGARVAVFASIWPETYGLVVDECLAAGIPVAAFGHGAVVDRAATDPRIRVAPPDAGAAGLAEAAGVLLVERWKETADGSPRQPPRIPDQAAAAMLSAYLHL